MENNQQFNANQCSEWLDNCIRSFQTTGDIPIADLGNFLFEFCKVFRQMGKLLSMAFSDVEEKVAVMKEIGILYQSECRGMLLATVRKEVSLNVAQLNGENNKKETKDKEYYKYNSLSRNLLRMMWFQNYLKIMFEELCLDRNQKTSKVFQKAYDDAFSKHHTFLVKTGAGLAMSAAPSRDKIKLYVLGNQNATDDQLYSVIGSIYQKIDKVKEIQWNFFESNNLTGLP